MKKTIALAFQIAFCILLTVAAIAQSGRAPQNQTNEPKPQTEQQPGNRPEQGGQRQAPEIPNLTDEQKGQLQTIRQQTREQIEAVRNNSTLSDQDRRTQIDSIRQNSREQVNGVLTPEQRESIANQRGNRQGHGNGEGRPGMNGQGTGERPNSANGQGQQGGERPQMGGQNGGAGGPRGGQNGGFGGPRGGRGGQGGGFGGPRGGGGRGGGRP